LTDKDTHCKFFQNIRISLGRGKENGYDSFSISLLNSLSRLSATWRWEDLTGLHYRSIYFRCSKKYLLSECMKDGWMDGRKHG
jgi:hypothetical protein